MLRGKRILLLLLGCLGIIFCSSSAALGITLNFAAIPGAKLEIVAPSGQQPYFDFVNNTTYSSGYGFSFKVSSEQGGRLGVGLFGKISGQFQISKNIQTGSDGSQSASLLTTAALAIWDGQGTQNFPNDNLTATIVWSKISMHGVLGSLFNSGNFAFTNIKYSGTNPDLLELAGAHQGNLTASFTLLPPNNSLSSLTTAPHQRTTSFSGTLSAIPLPINSTLVLVGTGLIGLLGLGWRRRAK